MNNHFKSDKQGIFKALKSRIMFCSFLAFFVLLSFAQICFAQDFHTVNSEFIELNQQYKEPWPQELLPVDIPEFTSAEVIGTSNDGGIVLIDFKSTSKNYNMFLNSIRNAEYDVTNDGSYVEVLKDHNMVLMIVSYGDGTYSLIYDSENDPYKIAEENEANPEEEYIDEYADIDFENMSLEDVFATLGAMLEDLGSLFSELEDLGYSDYAVSKDWPSMLPPFPDIEIKSGSEDEESAYVKIIATNDQVESYMKIMESNGFEGEYEGDDFSDEFCYFEKARYIVRIEGYMDQVTIRVEKKGDGQWPKEAPSFLFPANNKIILDDAYCYKYDDNSAYQLEVTFLDMTKKEAVEYMKSMMKNWTDTQFEDDSMYGGEGAYASGYATWNGSKWSIYCRLDKVGVDYCHFDIYCDKQ